MKDNIIKNDTTLTLRVYLKEGNKTTLKLETSDLESCLNHAITMLFDKAVGRYPLKIKQYYGDNGKEYCYLEQKQKIDNNCTYIDIVTGLRCDWGCYLNIDKTLKDNKGGN